MLPEGWKSVPLAEICSSPISYGIVQTGEHVPDGIPCLRVIDIAKKEIDLDECIRTNEIINSQYKRTLLKEGDIVLALRGEIGLAKIIDQRHSGVNITRGLAKISSDRKKLAPHFLFQALRAPSLKAELNRRSGGSALQEISLGELRKASILLPPLAEQKKIAAILSTWDRAIEGTEKLLANSQQQKKALMQQLLTGKKRLPGFTGEWIWKRSKEIFKSISIKNNPSTSELLSVTQDQGVIPRSALERRVVMPDGSVQGYKLVNPGNFIISLRSFQGGLEYSYYRGLVSPAYTVLDNKIEIENEFYKFYFKSYDFIGHLAVATIGIRDGKQISYEDFSFIKLPYPPVPEQKAIAAVLSTADEEITALESDLFRLRQEKKALMQQLLTGKRRVKVD